MKTTQHKALTLFILLAIALSTFPPSAPAQIIPPVFTDLEAGLPGVYLGAAGWADYDNDGDLDFAYMGSTGPADPPVVITPLYQNSNNHTFSPAPVQLPGLYYGALAWADYNRDGNMDLLLTGTTDAISGSSLLYSNTGLGGFTAVSTALPGVFFSSVAWGDFDRDGDLDLLLAGTTTLEETPITRIYRQTDDFSFVDIQAGLPGVVFGAVAWGDYDHDGWLDLLLTGSTNMDGSGPFTALYQNNRQGGFQRVAIDFPGLVHSRIAWGDFDADGDLDFVLTGSSDLYAPDASPLSCLYRNEGAGGFTNIQAGLPGVLGGYVAWADYDNDGDVDLVLTGTTNYSDPAAAIARVYRNDRADGFNWDTNALLPGVLYGSVNFADADNDGDLDLLLTGEWEQTDYLSRILQNNTATSNAPPTPPANLVTEARDFGVNLGWAAASDTPSTGLTYNLRVGTTPGGSQVVSPQSAPNGYRRLPQVGNVAGGLSAAITNLSPGIYYWSVQTVDAGFAGSSFAPEQTFQIVAQRPQAITLDPSALTPTEATLNGSVNPGGSPTWAWFEWGADTNYGHIAGATNVGFGVLNLSVAHLLSGLTSDVTNHYRIVATNIFGRFNGEDRSFVWRLLVVSNLNDAGPGSLRQSIADAGYAGTLDLRSLTGTITLAGYQLVLNKSLVIQGSGATNLSISGNQLLPVLSVMPQARVTLSGLTIRDGHAANGWVTGDGFPGGGIYNEGLLTLLDCVVTNNHAGDGGQAYGGGTGAPGGRGPAGGDGGGIFNGPAAVLTLRRCTVSGNRSGAGGIGGNGGHGIDGTISHSAGDGGPGGPGGNSGRGGGLFCDGVVTLDSCTFAGNTTGPGGPGGIGGGGGDGGVFRYDQDGGAGGSGGNAGSGAGIYEVGQVTLGNCTISGNFTGAGGSGGNGGHGGSGGYGTGYAGSPAVGGNGGNGAGLCSLGAMQLLCCTVANNITGPGGPGGSWPMAASPGTAGQGGGLSSQSTQAVQIVNTIVALNAAPIIIDVMGSFASSGYNLVGNTLGSSGFGVDGDITNVPPLLGPLAFNGGPTLTHGLLSGSPAIDAGANAYAPFATDQRGMPRFDERSGLVDIGAVELFLPTIIGISMEPGPTWRLYCSGVPNAPCTIQTSSNLVDWVTMTQLVPGTDGSFQWTDPDANRPVRFYRLRQP